MTGKYYVPASSKWPFVGSVALFFFASGIVNWLHQSSSGPYLFGFGCLILVYMFYGWFADILKESQQGLTQNVSLGRSLRWSMVWLIYCELMFFVAFFGALFYARIISIPA